MDDSMSDTPHNVFPINIEDIMHTAYLQYSLSVNVGRAIPDVRLARARSRLRTWSTRLSCS